MSESETKKERDRGLQRNKAEREEREGQGNTRGTYVSKNVLEAINRAE